MMKIQHLLELVKMGSVKHMVCENFIMFYTYDKDHKKLFYSFYPVVDCADNKKIIVERFCLERIQSCSNVEEAFILAMEKKNNFTIDNKDILYRGCTIGHMSHVDSISPPKSVTDTAGYTIAHIKYDGFTSNMAICEKRSEKIIVPSNVLVTKPCFHMC